MITVDSLTGLWRRSLLVTADGERDETTNVAWLQARPHYVDLRQPDAMPDFSHLGGLNDLSVADCRWLATQQGFAGFFRKLDDCFEWVRLLDFCPPGPVKDIGRLYWDGDVLVEEGRDIPYLEHWHRDPQRPVAPTASLLLVAPSGEAQGMLVRAGADFMYARGRAAPLPPGADLAALVAAAPDLEAARHLLDCEISQGVVEAGTWRITRSTLPYRAGDDLAPRLTPDGISVADRAASGAACRTLWRSLESCGDTSVFFDVSA